MIYSRIKHYKYFLQTWCTFTFDLLYHFYSKPNKKIQWSASMSSPSLFRFTMAFSLLKTLRYQPIGLGVRARIYGCCEFKSNYWGSSTAKNPFDSNSATYPVLQLKWGTAVSCRTKENKVTLSSQSSTLTKNFSKFVEKNRRQKNLVHQWVLLATIIDRFLLVIFLIYSSLTGAFFLYEALFSNGLPSSPFPKDDDPGYNYMTQRSCEFDSRL